MSPGDLVMIDTSRPGTMVERVLYLRDWKTWSVTKQKMPLNVGEMFVVLDVQHDFVQLLTPRSHVGWSWCHYFRVVSPGSTAVTGSLGGTP